MDQISVLRAGVVEHHVIAEVMKEMQQQRIDGEIPDTLIMVEHPEVVTIGPKAVREGVVVEGYPTSLTDRGGGITWHGPGQLVVYPIVKWVVEEQSVRGIIGRLEDWAISTLSDCGIEAYKDHSMQGAWVDGHKICSIGLSFLHWVSRHGMSINIRTPGTRVEDLEGCGMRAGMHTSLAQLGYTHDPMGSPLDMARIEEALLGTCQQHLGRSPLDPIEWNPEMPA
ncbi:MAG: lipoyl(octanoyl) transferase LipB [Candidatus Thalassarchaeaceae archaeon]|jgi:lipoate-protein ligase B|nr:lipoyl(octanoyl) transferase LipB [Candidatus Thalassarchaeaceae archaeon]MDP6702955.1 lipoyl(octanoyl) transferase LipB [Candidatus Thalassarchaeaceae archaeon]MDP7004268.1 lipoyl(octanoyl) transferase LipB [Candidatus Thalassarchaeaceae archaeon]